MQIDICDVTKSMLIRSVPCILVITSDRAGRGSDRGRAMALPARGSIFLSRINVHVVVQEVRTQITEVC